MLTCRCLPDDLHVRRGRDHPTHTRTHTHTHRLSLTHTYIYTHCTHSPTNLHTHITAQRTGSALPIASRGTPACGAAWLPTLATCIMICCGMFHTTVTSLGGSGSGECFYAPFLCLHALCFGMWLAFKMERSVYMYFIVMWSFVVVCNPHDVE